MKYSVIILGCMLAVAAAQFNNGQYVPEKERQNFYNYNNQYRYNQQYNPYNRFQNQRYRPFGSTTLAPRPYYFSSTTAAPARATFAPFKPLKPFGVVSSVAPPASSAAPEEPAPSASPAPVSPPAPSAAPAPVKPLINVYPSAVPVSKYYSDAANADIISYENDISPDGTFKYSFQTSNGIAAQEEGAPRSFYSGENAVSPVVAQGAFSWISPEGQDFSFTYVANEDGYQPSGAAIPQAPAVPPLIARALEFIARNVKSSSE